MIVNLRKPRPVVVFLFVGAEMIRRDERSNQTITAVPGLVAGHYTDRDNATGCTVIICRDGATGGVDVRGGSPGTRETDLLRPVHRVDRLHAVVLSGGSAFGLDAASGAAAYLADEGVGVRVGPALVPIVSAAILFDLGLISSDVRPGAAQGRAACENANAEPLEEGTVGAGTGATVAKIAGMDRALKSGIGCCQTTLPGGVVVAAVVAVNAYGGIVDHRSGLLMAGPRELDGRGMGDSVSLLLRENPAQEDSVLANTTIGLVATDAALTKEDANYLAKVSHDGLALVIRPCHTIRDGDTMFAMATGRSARSADLTMLGAAATEVTALAILRAISTATGLGGVPSASEFLGG